MRKIFLPLLLVALSPVAHSEGVQEVEIDAPLSADIVDRKFEAPDDAIIRIVRTCVCGSDFGVTVIPKSKKDIVIAVMRLSESSKKLVRLSLL